MGRISRVTRVIISLAISILTILFFYGYLAPFGLSPTLLFGSEFSNFFGTATVTGSVTNFVPSAYASLIPGGTSGLVIYSILSRIGGTTRAMMAPGPTSSSPEEMMHMMNIPQMMSGMNMMQGMANIPESLPADITRSQFIVLGCYRQGMGNSKVISKNLSMEEKDVESATSALASNGYLSKDSKLTSKAMDLLGR